MGWEGLESPFGGPLGVERVRKALPGVHEGSGGPLKGTGAVGRLSWLAVRDCEALLVGGWGQEAFLEGQ